MSQKEIICKDVLSEFFSFSVTNQFEKRLKVIELN